MSSKYSNEVIESSMGGGFTPAPSGNHLGVLVGVALLGTIDQTYKNVTSKKKMVRLYFELSNTINEEDEGKPFIVGVDLLNSMSPKSNMRKLINGAWGPITDEMAEKFNLVSLLGCQCMINVAVETAEKSGNQYNTVLGLSPIPDGVPVPVQKTEEFLFNFNPPFKQAEFELLEPFVQTKIKSSLEWLELVGAPAPQVQATAPAGSVPFAQQAAAPVATVAAGKRPFG